MDFHWGDFVSRTVRERGELVLGIDPVLDDIPACFRVGVNTLQEMLRSYVELVLAVSAPRLGLVKFQSACFEAIGSSGIAELAHSIAVAKYYGLGVILDCKRGDIGSTARAYARAYLDPASKSDLEVDCITVNPYLGPESLAPFVALANTHGKGLFVLAKTSNPGAGWLQDRPVGGVSVGERVAALVDELGADSVGAEGLSNVGAVVGATNSTALTGFRRVMPSAVILAPGVGAQGGRPKDLSPLRRSDRSGLLVPVSRGLTSADRSIERDDFSVLIEHRIDDLKRALEL